MSSRNKSFRYQNLRLRSKFDLETRFLYKNMVNQWDFGKPEKIWLKLRRIFFNNDSWLVYIRVVCVFSLWFRSQVTKCEGLIIFYHLYQSFYLGIQSTELGATFFIIMGYRENVRKTFHPLISRSRAVRAQCFFNKFSYWS